jgi:acyl-CoA carboxylase epsilon subunit-like protein
MLRAALTRKVLVGGPRPWLLPAFLRFFRFSQWEVVMDKSPAPVDSYTEAALFRVVRGNPTSEEIGALVVAILTLDKAGTDGHTTTQRRPSAWVAATPRSDRWSRQR